MTGTFLLLFQKRSERHLPMEHTLVVQWNMETDNFSEDDKELKRTAGCANVTVNASPLKRLFIMG